MGEGASQRGLRCSVFCNNFKVSEYGPEVATGQQCHGDSLISEFKTQFPTAYDRADPASQPPDSKTLNYLAVLSEEPFSDEVSTADEGVPPEGSGRPMMVGTGYASREICDGQSLPSPGRREVTQQAHDGQASGPCLSERLAKWVLQNCWLGSRWDT